MQGLRFEIQHADGRVEELTIEGDRALVGSGAHCEIRLPVDQAAVENVALQLGSTGLVAEARSFQPAPTINGSSFTRTQLLPDAVLGIGAARMRIVAVELGVSADVTRKKQEKTSPFTYILALVAVPISLYILLTDDGSARQAPAPHNVPALWSSPIETCPKASPEQALAYADDRLALADAKRERRPFHVQDGVQAVPLYETAAACYRTGHKDAIAKELSATAKKLREDVGEDFRTHRVRLEHALAIKDWQTAQREVRVLLAFTKGLSGDYVTWLSNLDRRLQLKYGGKQW